MRSIWSGSISFGLVNIPVKLYSAHASSHDIDFDMLHAQDHSPIRYAKICKHENKEVPFNEITKGVDTGGGNYLIIDEDDFAKALPRKTKTIEILNFCKMDEIDPIFFEKAYYLESDKQSDKPYILLHDALKSSAMVGVATFVLRAKEHLAMVRPYQGILMIEQLKYMDEISDLSQLRFPMKSTVNEKESSLAIQLIKQISKPFDPTLYKDTFSQEMKKIIRAKIDNKEISSKQEEPVPTEVSNLIETLSKSLSKK